MLYIYHSANYPLYRRDSGCILTGPERHFEMILDPDLFDYLSKWVL